MATGQMGLSGKWDMKVTRPLQVTNGWTWEIAKWQAKNWLRYRWQEIPLLIFLFLHWAILKRIMPGLTIVTGKWTLVKYDGLTKQWINYGCVGRHLTTTAGKQFVAACFDSTNVITAFKYMGFGSGSTAAAVGDTALQTEYTTQYATDNVRPTGSQGHSAATYITTATFAPDSGGTLAVTESGVFQQASNAGGTLLDHQVFSAVNLVAANGDTLAPTFTLTIG